MRQIDPEITLNSVRDIPTIVAEQLARPRFLASLLTSFSLFALLLALIGIYGVIAYGVKQREHEIAVRIALGADAGTVTGLFLREGTVLLLFGIAAGLLGAIGIGKLLEAQLFGVRPIDASTLMAVSLLIAAAGGLATWWPARRAALTDPIIALREE